MKNKIIKYIRETYKYLSVFKFKQKTKFAVITIGRSGSSELIYKLSSKVNIVPKPDNHLYPERLFEKYGKDIKVIFLTRNIADVVKSILQREIDKGTKWVEQHYKNLNSDFVKFPKILEEDTLNFENLYDAYNEQELFDVLFIKYENLFFNDNETMDALLKFTNLVNLGIAHNKENKWKGKYASKKDDKLNLIWDKSLQAKIDSYEFKLKKI